MTKEIKFLKSFVCPKCDEKQTVVGEEQLISGLYELDLESNAWEHKEDMGSEHKAWFCRSCGLSLPLELIKNLELDER